MQHEQIIKTLEKLIPEGVSNGPENVLLKYASENNLAPAQLERLAQMYNVAMTLNFMDKSANRGGSFDVIDVPDLLAKFTDPVDKQANVPDEWSAWFDSDMSKAASTFKVATSADDFIALAKGETPVEGDVVFKEAYEAYDSAITPGFWDVLKKEAEFKFEEDSVKQLISDAEEDFRKVASEVEQLLRTGADFREMSIEAQTLHGDAGVKAARALHSYLQPYCSVGEFAEGAVRIVKDSWKTERLFKEAAEAISRIKAAKDYLEFVKESAKSTFGTSFGDALTEAERNRQQGNNRPSKNAPDAEEAEPVGSRKRKRNKPRSDKGVTGMKSEEVTRGGGRVPLDSSLFYPIDGKANEAPEDPKAVDRLMSLADDARTGLQGIMNPETYTQGMDFETHLQKLKGLGSGKDKTQEAIDQAVVDTKDVTTIQRLMMTDPIISKADPEMVVSLANTLAKASPQVRNDPNLLRMALREAIQYEAIPIHTFKDLVEMEQRSQATQDLRSKNEDSRYKV